ncbi:hypothetical protein ACJMK2_019790 [Sinanodonta woodiana]|uniref:Bacterial surface antigen (D15) domain-containing protein n=1 Tax=Sinanodonta woodiana TaxID=1069815 RepID=A0ABD3TZH4_SINWO
MGTVHAKEPEKPLNVRRSANIKNLPVKVEKVVIDGLAKTKDDLVVQLIQPVFGAHNFEELIFTSLEVKSTLDRLGIFKRVQMTIDTSDESFGNDGYKILYEVEEKRTFSGSVNTLIGNNEGSLLFAFKFPNLFGRAERLSMEHTYGTNNTRGFGVELEKPVGGDPDTRLGGSVYQTQGEYPWSGYKETDRGVSLDLSFPTRLGAHGVKWAGEWRELKSLSRSTSFAVREQAGHSLKSSLKHTFVRDRRDDAILPTTGTFIKTSQEFAGLGGTAEFVKGDIELQANKSLFLDTVVQMSLAGGFMKSTDPQKEIKINDKFFLGGPLTLRGFNKHGVGPHSNGNALGADTFWLGALHLYTPLPFRPGKGGFGDLFKSHFFVNVGNCINYDYNRDVRDNARLLGENVRLAYGLGVVLRLGGVARLELNYVIPKWLQSCDSANPGLQFGIGLTFL